MALAGEVLINYINDMVEGRMDTQWVPGKVVRDVSNLQNMSWYVNPLQERSQETLKYARQCFYWSPISRGPSKAAYLMNNITNTHVNMIVSSRSFMAANDPQTIVEETEEISTPPCTPRCPSRQRTWSCRHRLAVHRRPLSRAAVMAVHAAPWRSGDALSGVPRGVLGG